MAHEFHLQFIDPDWYADHRGEVRAEIHALPSFIREATERELWLRANDSSGKWPYDVRIFLDPDGVLVEVTTFGTAYFNDVRSLIAALSRRVQTNLVDDDGEPVRW